MFALFVSHSIGCKPRNRACHTDCGLPLRLGEADGRIARRSAVGLQRRRSGVSGRVEAGLGRGPLF